MKIQTTTGYALKILQYIHEAGGGMVKAGELADKLNISRLYMTKLLGIMKNAGLVHSVQGCNGGYHMTKAAENTTVFEVYTAIEGNFHLYRPQTNIEEYKYEAAIKRYFDMVGDMVELFMRRTTICDLFDQQTKETMPKKQRLEQIAR